jgi:hypothetical protein
MQYINDVHPKFPPDFSENDGKIILKWNFIFLPFFLVSNQIVCLGTYQIAIKKVI